MSKKNIKIDKNLLKQIMENKKRVIETRNRSQIIIPEFIGATIGIYNGKKYIPVIITENKVGFKLGQFAPTRVLNRIASERTKQQMSNKSKKK